MPGVPVPSLGKTQALTSEASLRQTVQEIRQELQAYRLALERRLEEALCLVRPLAAALSELREENAALQAKQEQLIRSMKQLGLYWDEESKDPSTLLLEAKDPGAHFSGTGEPVAHPPTFSSTRRHSEVHLSRGSSVVGPPVPRNAQRW